jgi:two-component system, NarL family, sensor kinase
MPQPEYQLIAGVIITVFVFLIIGFFVVILVTYVNQRKKKHLEEKQAMQLNFQEEILRTQLEIQEQTFNHISQEIHDNVGQILSLAKVQINIMQQSDNRSDELLNEVKENVAKAMSDLRDIAKSLSSERIRSMSMVEAVRIETERISKSGTILATVSCEGEERQMDEQKKQILFRILQECLQNIIKHAQATELYLQFHYLPEMLDILVKDNGKGFDVVKEMGNSSGLGLQNIKTRASLIGAELAIESDLDKGCAITIKMPHE